MQEKDTNSFLNTFNDRGQDVAIANWYIQDFIFPGYTAEFSVHFDHDQASHRIRQQRLPCPSRSGWRRLAAHGRRRLSWLCGRRALEPVQREPCVLLGRRLRFAQSAGQPGPGHQRRHGRHRTLLRPGLGPLPHLVFLVVGRQGHQQPSRHRLRYDHGQSELCRRRIQLLATPASRPAEREPDAARKPGPRPAGRASSRGRPTSSIPV